MHNFVQNSFSIDNKTPLLLWDISQVYVFLIKNFKLEFSFIPFVAISYLEIGSVYRGVLGGGRASPPPSTCAPPERLRGGTHEGGSFNITSACISLPQARHSGVTRGQYSCCPPWEFQAGHCPPGKYKIKRKLRLKSNTWQWQRLRICLNSLLIQGEKSFSLLKRILHYTRCTMTKSKLNDLALIALHPI